MGNRFVLEDVPPITGHEHADIFLDALSIALCYSKDELPGRFGGGVFNTFSGFTGRGWLVGFDDASYYWERHGVSNPNANFAASSVEAYLTHADTMADAFRFVDRAPEFLWNQGCAHPVDPAQAAGFMGMSRMADSPAIRQYVTDYLVSRRSPAIALLHLPGVGAVDMTLLTGYESGGDIILGRSLLQGLGTDNSGEYGYFRLPDWEREVLAVVGIGEERKTEWEKHPCFIAIGNCLKCARSYTEGTRHYGLAAYDAWERALLDDGCIAGVDDETVSRRLLYHSMTAGSIACQKCFTAMPECWAPSMGVVDGLVRRASAGTSMIHGLMWDAWQAVGGYWRGAKDGDAEHRVRWEGPEELERFRDRAVRERAAAVIQRARKVDAQAIHALEEAKDDWERCIGHGSDHPCPCWGSTVCARV